MKSFWMLCSCCLALIQPAAAAEPPDEASAPHPPPAVEAGQAPASNMPPHLWRWLQRVQKRNTNEYQRLLQLWQTDPWAFREEIRQRLDQARLARVLKNYPEIREAYDRLPPAEKKRFVRSLFRPPLPPPHYHGQKMRFGRKWPRARIRQLVEEYHNTTDPQQRVRLRAALQEQLQEQFEEAERRHAERLEHLRHQLQRLEEELQFRAAHRADIIQEQMDLLLDDSP